MKKSCSERRQATDAAHHMNDEAISLNKQSEFRETPPQTDLYYEELLTHSFLQFSVKSSAGLDQRHSKL